MKKLKPQEKVSSDVIQLPGFPIRGNKLFERVGAAVGAARGYPLGNTEFARIIGKPESTTSLWFGASLQPHLVAWLCLIEHLMPQERHRVLDELCRDLPFLAHPRLRHNPIMVGMLKNLLAQKAGLTIVNGGSEAQRTFLLTALGHSFCRLDRLHRTPSGIDLHEPQWFVPLETVTYLRTSPEAKKTPEAIKQLWPSIRSSKNPVIVLNGVWSKVPEIGKDIISLAGQRHVIVAEQAPPVGSELTLAGNDPVHSLVVSTSRENASWLAVEIRRL
jgi:hypothetical protein